MTPDEKVKLDQLGKAITDITIELVELKKMNSNEVTFLGAANDSEVTLAELEATCKVLKGYKVTGFKNIRL